MSNRGKDKRIPAYSRRRAAASAASTPGASNEQRATTTTEDAEVIIGSRSLMFARRLRGHGESFLTMRSASNQRAIPIN